MPGDVKVDRVRKTPRRLRVAWSAVLPLAAALFLGIGSLSIIRMAARSLGLLVIAIALAEAVEPLVSWLERRMKRALAITIVFLSMLVIVGLAGWLVVPTLIAQGQALVQRAPQMVSTVQHFLQRLDTETNGLVTRAAGGATTWVTHVLVQLPGVLMSTVTDLLVVIFLSIYWLAGIRGLSRFMLSFAPESRAENAAKLMHEMGQAMGGYVRGAAINAAIMAVLATGGLFLIGVNYPVALGVITGMGEPFPYIGPFAAAVPVVLVALLQSPTKALIALGLYCFLQELEGHVLTPNVMERQTSIPQTLVILAIIIGAEIGGLLGIIVAIPSAAALHVFALRVIAPAVRRLTGADASGTTPSPSPSEGARSTAATNVREQR